MSRYKFDFFTDRFRAMKELRDKGYTHREIAILYDISEQRVVWWLGKGDERYFKPITEKQCVFVGIRDWLNQNKVSITEFVRRVYGVYHTERRKSLLKHLTKKFDMKKQMIDRVLEITGLTYEEAFKEQENE